MLKKKSFLLKNVLNFKYCWSGIPTRIHSSLRCYSGECCSLSLVTVTQICEFELNNFSLQGKTYNQLIYLHWDWHVVSDRYRHIPNDFVASRGFGQSDDDEVERSSPPNRFRFGNSEAVKRRNRNGLHAPLTSNGRSSKSGRIKSVLTEIEINFTK
jgi:hypothetical protein